MSDEKSKKPWEDIIKWEYESARQKEKIFKTTIKELSQNPSLKSYFKQYQNAEKSIESYAWQKSGWLVDKLRIESCIEYNSPKYMTKVLLVD